MKKFLVVACVVIMSCTGCAKEEKGCTPVSPASEEARIKDYATASGITAQKDPSGLYYQIIEPGTGVTPTRNSIVQVGYVGKLLNGQIFDQNTSYKEVLGGLIEGWQIGIPLIKKGGKIRLIVPSALAYACNRIGPIGANEILFFEVSLLDVQ
jgi:FKBP-type peptidyl-prolyl cis-trans isomerase FkpA